MSEGGGVALGWRGGGGGEKKEEKKGLALITATTTPYHPLPPAQPPLPTQWHRSHNLGGATSGASREPDTEWDGMREYLHRTYRSRRRPEQKKRKVKKGELILVSEPFVSIVNNENRLKYCDYCITSSKYGALVPPSADGRACG